MKKLISIPLIILLAFSGISIKFATHFCGGYVAATNVSLTGELATCGMEHSPDNKSFQDIFTTKCCDDVTSEYSICNNYYPSSSSIYDSGLNIIYNIDIPVYNLYNQHVIICNSGKNKKPPGAFFPNSVSRPDICIYLI